MRNLCKETKNFSVKVGVFEILFISLVMDEIKNKIKVPYYVYIEYDFRKKKTQSE